VESRADKRAIVVVAKVPAVDIIHEAVAVVVDPVVGDLSLVDLHAGGKLRNVEINTGIDHRDNDLFRPVGVEPCERGVNLGDTPVGGLLRDGVQAFSLQLSWRGKREGRAYLSAIAPAESGVKRGILASSRRAINP